MSLVLDLSNIHLWPASFSFWLKHLKNMVTSNFFDQDFSNLNCMQNLKTSVITSILYQVYNPLKIRHLNEVIFTHATRLWTGNHWKRQFVRQNGRHWANRSKVKVVDALIGFVHGYYFIISQNKNTSVILRMVSFHVCNLYNDIFRGYYTHDVFVKWNALKMPIFLCNGAGIAVSVGGGGTNCLDMSQKRSSI